MTCIAQRILIAVTLITAAAATAAACPSTQHYTTDQQLFDVLDGIAFVAEGRIGDRGGAATFELDLGQDTGAPDVQENYDWSSGVTEPFSLTYDSGSNTVTFSLGGRTLQYQPLVGFEDMFIRCRAVDANTQVSVDNLFLDGCPVADQASADGNGSGLDILALTGIQLDQGFTLTGNATLTWTGTAPSQSRLAFQIKVGNTPQVGIESRPWSAIKLIYLRP
jgi:hypothetical protein